MQLIEQLVGAISKELGKLEDVHERGFATFEFEKLVKELCREVERRARNNLLTRESAERIMGIFLQMVDGFIRWCPDNLAYVIDMLGCLSYGHAIYYAAAMEDDADLRFPGVLKLIYANETLGGRFNEFMATSCESVALFQASWQIRGEMNAKVIERLEQEVATLAARRQELEMELADETRADAPAQLKFAQDSIRSATTEMINGLNSLKRAIDGRVGVLENARDRGLDILEKRKEQIKGFTKRKRSRSSSSSSSKAQKTSSLLSVSSNSSKKKQRPPKRSAAVTAEVKNAFSAYKENKRKEKEEEEVVFVSDDEVEETLSNQVEEIEEFSDDEAHCEEKQGQLEEEQDSENEQEVEEEESAKPSESSAEEEEEEEEKEPTKPSESAAEEEEEEKESEAEPSEADEQEDSDPDSDDGALLSESEDDQPPQSQGLADAFKKLSESMDDVPDI